MIPSHTLATTLTPHPVLRTLNKRMGDCKDKSALLVAMLNQIGVEAHPVLVATDRLKPESSPVASLGVFDHMAVCFDWLNNNYCVDPTDSTSDWRYTSPYIQGRVALPLFGSNQLQTIAPAPFRWRAHFESTVVFDKAGGQTEHQTRRYIGEYASVVRDQLLGLNQKDRYQKLLERYQSAISDQVKPKFKVSGIADTSKDLVIRNNTQHSPFTEADQDLDYSEADAWLKKALEDSTLDNKLYEYQTAGMWVTSKVTWDISALWKTKALPAELSLNNAFGSLERQVKRLDSGKIEITTELKIPRQLVPAKDLTKFNRYIKLLEKERTLHGTGWRLPD